MSLDIYLTKRQTCPNCGHEFGDPEGEAIHSQNITHNLGGMAGEAGIYECLWHPEESGIKSAGQLIAPLRQAIEQMESDPERFKKHNAPNGWGMYEHFVPWLKRLLTACEESPGAGVRASR